MNSNKHKLISDELEQDIKNDIFKDKLPSVRELSKRFNVSTRTITKAIKTLTGKGLTIPSGSNGILINQKKHIRPKTGNVVVFCNRNSSDLKHDVLLEELRKVIKSDSLCPLFLNTPHNEIFQDEKFWKSGWVDGYIFIYSSFDRQFAQQLKRNHIPFVVANNVPEEYGVNSIDFDIDGSHRRLIDELGSQGFKRICYCAIMKNPENHEAYVKKLFADARKKYSLELDYHIYPAPEGKLTSEYIHDCAKASTEIILKQNTKVEAALTLFSPSILKHEFDMAGLKDLYIIASISEADFEKEKDFPCAIHSYRQLADQTYKRLKEIFKEQDITVQQTKLQSQYHLL